jgi:trimeric autotransporter adhesin
MAMVLDGTGGITTNSGTLLSTSDATINGQTVGKGGGNVATNTVHGVSALNANTTATNNTAIGYQAGYTNTTSSQNTYVGSGAGYLTTGQNNVGVGLRIMFAGAGGSGGQNTAIGNYALYVNDAGGYNTALGMQALFSNTTASNNTAVGYQAGYAITTQSNNIYIGYSCGSSQTGSGGIFIGANAFSGYNGNNQVAFKTGDGREALYADINAGASFRQYSNSSTWATTSDQRVKENIVEITDGLEKIIALRPVTFDYITSKEHNAGFIAQDFQNVLPDQVKKVKARPEEAELVGEDEIYSIQQNLVPYLVNAIKDLKALVDAQAAEIAELKAKVM